MKNIFKFFIFYLILKSSYSKKNKSTNITDFLLYNLAFKVLDIDAKYTTDGECKIKCPNGKCK